MNANDDLGMAEPDAPPTGDLPFLNGRIVYRRTVRRVQVGQQRQRPVPPDLEVSTRNPGVREAELGVLSAADHVGALAQLVGATTAVIELQCHRGAGCAVTLSVSAGLSRLLAVVIPGRLACGIGRIGL